jgi:CheY-like chemotaxis protein
VRVSVLIVDDHDSFRGFARRLLERAGYAVIGEAGDGASALAAVDALEPDVVLLDVLLPDASGFAVADALAARPSPRRPIVLLTSSRSASDFGAALRGRSFLAKSELSATRIRAALAETA